jgi:phytoene dehydrogenase-like protein
VVRAVPSRIRGDAAGTIAATTWAAAKEAFADRVLGIVERYAPGVRAHILARHVMSPDDLEALDPNLVGGDTGAGSHHLSQHYGRRPFPGWPRHRLPVAGLYLCGAATWPGAGATPLSGTRLAAELLAGGAGTERLDGPRRAQTSAGL